MTPARRVAADLMRGPVETVREDMSVREAAQRMLAAKVGAMPVVTASGDPIGMVSDGDLLGRREIDPRREWWLDLVAEPDAPPRPLRDDRKVREVMSAPLVTIAPRTPASEVATLMRLNHVKRLPVVEAGRLVGIVSRADLVGLVESLAPPAAPEEGSALLTFLQGLIGGASLTGRLAPRPPRRIAPAETRPHAFTAAALRAEAEGYEADRQSRLEAERTAARLRRQDELKARLQAHVDEALWHDLIDRAEAAAARGERECEWLRFPCALCRDGARAIDVHESGWEATLRGEPAELYQRFREELQAQGFRLDARIVGWDAEGAIAEAALFLQWGA